MFLDRLSQIKMQTNTSYIGRGADTRHRDVDAHDTASTIRSYSKGNNKLVLFNAKKTVYLPSEILFWSLT